jgi:integrase
LKEKPRERCLSSEEIKLLWNTLSCEQLGKSGRRLYVSDPVSLVLKLLLVTAQRSSEVSQAKVSEFDLVHRVWTIPADRAKNGRSHRVPLSDMALELIKVAHSTNNGSEFLFPSKVSTLTSEVGERPIISTAANHALRKVLKSVSLSNITPHDFRETAATGMMYLGVPEQNVAAVLNHARTSVTAKHYARHSFEAEKREALKKWAVHLAEIIEA